MNSDTKRETGESTSVSPGWRFALSSALSVASLVVAACSTRDSLGERGSVATASGGSSGVQDASASTMGAASGGIVGSGGSMPFGGNNPGGASGSSLAVGGDGNLVGSGGTSNLGSGGTNVGSGGIPPSAGAGGSNGTPRDAGAAVDGGGAPKLHIVTATVTVAPGAEVFRCYHARVPSNVDIEAAGFTSHAPSLNEMMVYKVASDTEAEGTLGTTGCTVDFGPSLLYVAYSDDYALPLPSGVGKQLGAHQPLLMDLHFLNSGADPLDTGVSLDIAVGQGSLEEAQAIVSFNTSILLPPKGTQTVSGDCTVPSGAKTFWMTTHTNHLATDASVVRKLANGQLGEGLVDTTDYAHPAVSVWSAPSFLTLQPGEKLHYACVYQNTASTSISVGTSALTNEMCMSVSFFFAATSAGSCN